MKKVTCILCPNGCSLNVDIEGERYRITGNKCRKGIDFAISELTDPRRSISSTVRTVYRDTPRMPVRTDGEIPLKDIFPAMEEINQITVDHPWQMGDVVIANLLGTGINVIATSSMEV